MSSIHINMQSAFASSTSLFWSVIHICCFLAYHNFTADFVLTSVFNESKSSLHLDGLLASEDYSVIELTFFLTCGFVIFISLFRAKWKDPRGHQKTAGSSWKRFLCTNWSYRRLTKACGCFCPWALGHG